MFAGPNGSGKSTLKSVLKPEWLGHYLNADEIEQALVLPDGLSLSSWPIELKHAELQAFLQSASILKGQNIELLQLRENRLFLDRGGAGGYYAAAVGELLRHKLMEKRESFTFETVMSHPSKVQMLRDAREAGYRTYLYYIATDDPDINVSRVAARVADGGHDVPEDKIRLRFARSLELLPAAIQASDRAYIFDNSGRAEDRALIAEFEGGSTMRLGVEPEDIPIWFIYYVIMKLTPDD